MFNLNLKSKFEKICAYCKLKSAEFANMRIKNETRNLLGYALGIGIFLVIIPIMIYRISAFDNGLIAKIFAALCFVIGAYFVLFSNIHMRNFGHGNPADAFGFSIGKRTKKLMREGIYKQCRNPMLFGVFMFYLSVALWLNSFLGVIFAVAFLVFMSFYIKRYEEPRLSADFGKEYEEYRTKTPFVIPISKMKFNKLLEIFEI